MFEVRTPSPPIPSPTLGRGELINRYLFLLPDGGEGNSYLPHLPGVCCAVPRAINIAPLRGLKRKGSENDDDHPCIPSLNTRGEFELRPPLDHSLAKRGINYNTHPGML